MADTHSYLPGPVEFKSPQQGFAKFLLFLTCFQSLCPLSDSESLFFRIELDIGRSHKNASPHLFDVPQRHQAPALAGGLDDLGVWVETLGEVLVAAALPAGTHLGVTLVLQHAVETLRLEPARPLICGLAVALWDLGDVCSVDLNLTNRFVDLRRRKRRHQ